MGPEPIEGATDGSQIWGWMAPVELAWLTQTASEMNSVVEVGSLRGRSAYALLKGCPGKVYCIDPWNDERGQCWPAFMENVGHFPNLVPVPGYSPAVTTLIPDVDMVFIDGAHDRASVKADIVGWLPKTKKLICGHDYVHDGGFPDVATVVDEVFGDRVRVGEGTSIWYVELV